MWKCRGRKSEVVEASSSDSEKEDVVDLEFEDSGKPTKKRSTRSNKGRLSKGGGDEGENDDCDGGVNSLPQLPTSSRTSSKMMIVHKDVGESGWNNLEQVTLTQPRTGHKALFLMDTQKVSDSDVGSKTSKKFFLYEIMTMENETRSWFLDDSVVSDGNLYVSTPIDPLFMVLPLLMKSSHAKPLRDHLIEELPSNSVVEIFCSQLLSSSQLENIAAKIVCDDIIAFKYSEENTIAWLSEKVERTVSFLSERDISNTEASISSNFTKSSADSNKVEKDREKYLWYACEIVGEYLQEEIKKKLFAKFGIPIVQEKNSGTKRKGENDSGVLNESQNKKAKVADDGSILIEPVEDYGSSKTASAVNSSVNSKTNAKAKEFQKAAKGSRSLLTFFTPKAK